MPPKTPAATLINSLAPNNLALAAAERAKPKSEREKAALWRELAKAFEELPAANAESRPLIQVKIDYLKKLLNIGSSVQTN